jgi:hypothetical protein
MKQYVIDELRLQDHQKVKQYLDEQFGPAEIGGIYWVPLAEEALSEIQKQHGDCRPFYVAIELQEDKLALELLVRTKSRIRCDCIRYADADQRIWIMDLIDAMLERLDIMT